MNSDTKAAMERRRIYLANPTARAWDNGGHLFGISKVHADDDILADAYLAEHPDDSETPVDETILGAWGDNRDEFFYSEWNDSEDIRIVVKKDMRYAMIESGGEDGDVIFIPIPKTRGDVRQLCRALGIPLKESGND